MTSGNAPAPRTRPRNRREITLRTASELFARKGYSNVSMSEIAKATNVSAMAIYKHFESKSALLVAAVQEGIDRYTEVLDSVQVTEFTSPSELHSVLSQLSEIALDLREWGVLWQRQLRSLDLTDQRVLRVGLSAVAARLAALIAQVKPGTTARQCDVLAWCVMGTFVSVGFHSLLLPQRAYVSVLASIAMSVIETVLSEAPPREHDLPEALRTETTRRDSLLARATELFADRGYGAVSVDEIGDAAGISGPSVYNHFSSKQALLSESVRRGSSRLRADLERAFIETAESPTRLEWLVDSFIELAVEDRFVVQIVLSELDQLEASDRQFAEGEQRAYIDAWQRLLMNARPQSAVAARVRVHAVLLVINDAVQTPHLRAQPELPQELHQVAMAMLEISR